MTEQTTVLQEISQLIADKAKMNVSDMHGDLNLEGSGLDSFARIELILVIEEKYGIELTDAESANVSTINDIVEIIVSKSA